MLNQLGRTLSWLNVTGAFGLQKKLVLWREGEAIGPTLGAEPTSPLAVGRQLDEGWLPSYY